MARAVGRRARRPKIAEVTRVRRGRGSTSRAARGHPHAGPLARPRRLPLRRARRADRRRRPVHVEPARPAARARRSCRGAFASSRRLRRPIRWRGSRAIEAGAGAAGPRRSVDRRRLGAALRGRARPVRADACAGERQLLALGRRDRALREVGWRRKPPYRWVIRQGRLAPAAESTRPPYPAAVRRRNRAAQGPAIRVIQVLRSPNRVRIVAAPTVWSPPLPRTSTVAARPDGVRARDRAGPAGRRAARRRACARASRCVNRAVQVWYGDRSSCGSSTERR